MEKPEFIVSAEHDTVRLFVVLTFFKFFWLIESDRIGQVDV